MPRAQTPTFILELPLKTTPVLEKKLRKRFEAARQVYNACLGESLKRLRLLRQSKAYQAARKMPRGQARSPERKARARAFRDAEAAVGLREYDIAHWATQFTHSWIHDHLGSQEVKGLVKRAFAAVRRYQFTSQDGKKRKRPKGYPRFKRAGEMHSVENITNLQGLRWREDGRYVQWRGLEIPAIVDEGDPVQQHGLSCRVKYVRVLKKTIRGRDRFYVQLVLEGDPLQRRPTVDGAVVGLDIGPSTVAAVGEKDAFLVQFCAELEDIGREIRILQRKLDRQRRANNPDNYYPDGTIRPGSKRWHRSKRMRKTEARLAELQRRQAAYRKSLHGELANRVLAMGNVVQTEKLSYRAFQRAYGKSVGRRAPGAFVEMLRRKAKAADGELVEFPIYTTRLSQICHNCGTVVKKTLSQRWHKCDCGTVAQRDLYSAFLASCVDEDTLDAGQARDRWPAADSLLRAAFRDVESANGEALPSSFGANRRQSGSPA